MAQDILAIDGDGRGIGSEVDQGTARTLLSLREYAVGQCQRCQVHLRHADACHLETSVEVAVEGLPFEDVQEITLQTGGLDAHRVDLVLGVDLVFLDGCIEDLLILIFHVAVGVHEFDHHVLGDDGLCRQVLTDHIPDTANRLSAYTDIHLGDFRLQLVL